VFDTARGVVHRVNVIGSHDEPTSLEAGESGAERELERSLRAALEDRSGSHRRGSFGWFVNRDTKVARADGAIRRRHPPARR
jgi:hypothetical protein